MKNILFTLAILVSFSSFSQENIILKTASIEDITGSGGITRWSGKPYTGVFLFNYENGQLKKIENFKDGKRQGESIEYYQSGEIKEIKNYKDGVLIDIVEDEEEIEETVIESTESDQDEDIEVEDIVIEEVYEDVEVPFSVIENVPEYPGCEIGSNAEKRKCMSAKIAEFVQRNFNINLAGDLGLSGRQRINVIFKIDKSGNVVGVRSRAPHPRLEKEVARVINMLPKMKPGRHRGEAVVVPYSLPLTFQVQD